MNATGRRRRRHAAHKQRKITPFTVLQSLYLTLFFYVDNDMFSYASACAFGFLFSFIPVVMLILVIVLQILHASPETITALIRQTSYLSDAFNLEYITALIANLKGISVFETVMGLAIVWMARRFFSSVNFSMNKLFRQMTSPHPVLRQLLIFAGEALLIIVTSATVFMVITCKTVFQLEMFGSMDAHFPGLSNAFRTRLANLAPTALLFLCVLVCYKGWSRTRPPWSLCIAAAAANTAVFWLFRKIMMAFININNYNIIYGVLSSVIVLLLEVYFFFVLFLFFAQYLFVCQFFDTLLLSQLYLLPDRKEAHFISAIKRSIFIHPDFLLASQAEQVIFCPKGSTIYRQGEYGDAVFYVVDGTVELSDQENMSRVKRGAFFGEGECLLSQKRWGNARADTDVQVVKIKSQTFLSLFELNPAVAKKALAQISDYFAKFYGRSTDYPL